MAWTTPRTWLVGDTVTAGGVLGLNPNITDNLIAIKPKLISVIATIGAIAAHTGAAQNVATGASTLAVGDLCFLAGRGDSTLREVVIWAEPVVTTANQVTIQCFNSDTASTSALQVTLRFLKIPAAGVA